MMKAVRFSEDKDDKLIDFIEDFRDTKNKKNHSEAIRYLMRQGLKYLEHQEEFTKINDSKQNNQQQIDIDKIKQQIRTELMDEITNSTLSNLNSIVDKLSNIQPVTVQESTQNNTDKQFTKINDSNNKQFTKINDNKQKVDIPADTDPLLANLLNNANR